MRLTGCIHAQGGGGDVDTDVVDSLWEGSILPAVAGVFPGCEGHGSLIHGIPITQVPLWLKWCDNLWLGRAWSSLPKEGIGKCQEGGEEGNGEVLHFSIF